MTIPWSEMLLGMAISFIAVGLRGLQTKNVQGDHERLAFFTSYLMSFAEVASIGMIVTNGWWMVLPTGTGAAFGIVLAMRFHRRFVTKKLP